VEERRHVNNRLRRLGDICRLTDRCRLIEKRQVLFFFFLFLPPLQKHLLVKRAYF
jgi:hypothetical protein